MRATQVAFDLAEKVQHTIRKQAVEENLTLSDYVRKVLGLKNFQLAKTLAIISIINS